MMQGLSPHLHGTRFCTRRGIVTLGECPNSAHSFTYNWHHNGANHPARPNLWDFSRMPASRRPFTALPQNPICAALPHPGATAPASGRAWPLRPATGRSAPFLYPVYTRRPKLYPVFTPRSVTCRCPDWSLRLRGPHPLLPRMARRTQGASLPGGKNVDAIYIAIFAVMAGLTYALLGLCAALSSGDQS